MANIILLACCAFIYWLLAHDKKLRRFSNWTLWIPAIWLAVTCSRSPAQWLSVFGLYQVGGDGSTGNPVDTTFFFGILSISVIVLQRRQIRWGQFAAQNKIIVLIYLFFLCSASWSDLPPTTAKRVVKDFTHVLVALILLSDRNPIQAIQTVFVRVSYFLFPLSIVFIKYFPDIGRVHNRSGSNLFAGVATHKNTLGLMVFCLGLVIVIDLIAYRKKEIAKIHRFIRYSLLAMGIWLLLTCDSVTALVCLIVGIVVVNASQKLGNFKSPGRVFGVVLAMGIVATLIEATFQVASTVMAAFGRDMTLTGRTDIWASVLAAPTNPLLGTGFYSFWTTEMAQPIIEPFGQLNTAHNGFIETYLDGGLIALTLLILWILSAGWQNLKLIVTESLMARLSIAFFTISLLYNNSETNFFRSSPLWFCFLLATIKYHNVNTTRLQRPSE